MNLPLKKILKHRAGEGVRITSEGITVVEIIVREVDKSRKRTRVEIVEDGNSRFMNLYSSSPPLELREGIVIRQSHIPVERRGKSRLGRVVYITYELSRDYFAWTHRYDQEMA